MSQLGLQLGATALALTVALPAAALPAFPGAVGYGAAARGGRGGAIYQVTNLNDAGPGSLRACVQATSPRACVFRVAGTITLASALRVTSPYLTIAGQTAPGSGVALRISRSGRPLEVFTNDVVIRHIRVRPGLSACDANACDGILLMRARNVILDHVSFSWALDENLDVYQTAENVTFQNVITSNGLWDHSKGALICSSGQSCGKITFYQSLFSSNRDRQPEIQGNTANLPHDLINNVFYNSYSEYTELWDGARVNVVGNVYRRGPWGGGAAVTFQSGRATAYISDNLLDGVSTLVRGTGTRSPVPVAPLSVAPAAANTVLETVLANAGAFPRDVVDTAVLSHARNRTSEPKYATSPALPLLAAGPAYADADKDGMGDSWELANGLNPADPADRNTVDASGYTRLDLFLAARADCVVAGSCAGALAR
jgi:pectate lyase